MWAHQGIVFTTAGESPDKQQQAKATQLQLLVDAEGVCSSAQAQAARGATGGPILAVLTALQAGFASLKRLIEGPSDDKNEVYMQQGLPSIVSAEQAWLLGHVRLQ